MGIFSKLKPKNKREQKSITTVNSHIRDSIMRVDNITRESKSFVKRIRKPVSRFITESEFAKRYERILSEIRQSEPVPKKTTTTKKPVEKKTEAKKPVKKTKSESNTKETEKKTAPKKPTTTKKPVEKKTDSKKKTIEAKKPVEKKTDSKASAKKATTKAKAKASKSKTKVADQEPKEKTMEERRKEQLLDLKIAIDKKTRIALYDFTLVHFYNGDLRTRNDFEKKFQKVMMEKFEKKGLTIEDAKKLYNFVFKWFKEETKVFGKELTEKDQQDFEKTIALKDSARKGAIKESMHFTLDNVRSIQTKKLLTREKEQMYARMCHSSDPQERERGRKNLISANLRLIISVAKKYNHKGIDLSDLFDEGFIGLNKAIEKFDASKNFKFSTYATWWIRQSITRAISEQAKSVRIPVHIIEQMQKSSKTERNIALRAGTEPTQNALNSELKEKHKINLVKLNLLKKTSSDPISFDKSVGDFENSKFSDFLADETLQRPNEFVADALQAERIKLLLKVLNERESEVIERYFGFPPHNEPTKNLSEIARTMKMKPEAIKSIYGEALNKLKRYSRELERHNKLR